MADGKPCGIETNTSSSEGAICGFHGAGISEDTFHAKLNEKLQRALTDPAVKQVDFTKFVFYKHDFPSFKFTKSVIFRDAVFKGQTSFKGSTFAGPNNIFSGCRFEGHEADFSETSFRGRTRFISTHFHNKVTDFSNATFEGEETDFSESTFDGKTKFIAASFKGIKTSFLNTQFRGNEIRFDHAEFHCDETDFGGSEFSAKEFALFSYSDFIGKKASFSSARFYSETTLFQNTRFGSEMTDFSGIWSIGDRLLFHDSLFLSPITEFDRSVFEKDLDFTVNVQRNLQPMFAGSVSMKDLILRNPEHVTFRSVDLSKVEFAGTDLSKIIFVDTKWSTIPLKIFGIIPSRGRNALYEETLLREWENRRNSSRRHLQRNQIELIRVAYNQLKCNFEEKKNYAEANTFYYGEMEMRRFKLPILRRKFFSWEWLYWLASGYGLSWENGFILLLASFFLSPILFLFSGLQTTSGNINYDLALKAPQIVDVIRDYKSALEYNLNVIFFRTSSPYEASFWTKLLTAGEIVLLPTFATLFILALRRKFKR